MGTRALQEERFALRLRAMVLDRYLERSMRTSVSRAPHRQRLRSRVSAAALRCLRGSRLMHRCGSLYSHRGAIC